MTGWTPQVEPEVYEAQNYNTKERFCSFWHQADEVLRLGARTVLEVGPGAGYVTDRLRRAGLTVTTLDIDDRLGPDVVGSVTALPFGDKEFDAVLCCEVLEHLTWPEAERAMAELARVARTGAVVSLPDVTPWVGGAFPLYFGLHVDSLRGRLAGRGPAQVLRDVLARRVRLRDVLFILAVPASAGRGDRVWALRRPPVPHVAWRHEFDGQHHWEIGIEGFPASRIRSALESAGLRLERSFRVPELPWHHFYVGRVDGR